jgi:hypothetical protein
MMMRQAEVDLTLRTTSNSEIELRDEDVLSGRGGLSNKHPGNHVYRRIVSQNKETYQKCEKKLHKFFLAISIIAAVERVGGRFLRRDESAERWIELPRSDAISKTAQALREQEGRSKRSTDAVEPFEEEKQFPKRQKMQHHQIKQKQPTPTKQHCKQLPMSPNIRPFQAFSSSHLAHPSRQIRDNSHFGQVDCSVGIGYQSYPPVQQHTLTPSHPEQQRLAEEEARLDIILRADVGIPYFSMGSDHTNRFADLEQITLEEDLSIDSSSCSSDEEYEFGFSRPSNHTPANFSWAGHWQ